MMKVNEGNEEEYGCVACGGIKGGLQLAIKKVTVEILGEKNFTYKIVSHELSQECKPNLCQSLFID